jgi:hypothetical protein
MRSLWRTLASQWLGGDASEGPAAESAVLESLISGDLLQPTPAFSVLRDQECLTGEDEVSSGAHRSVGRPSHFALPAPGGVEGGGGASSGADLAIK